MLLFFIIRSKMRFGSSWPLSTYSLLVQRLLLYLSTLSNIHSVDLFWTSARAVSETTDTTQLSQQTDMYAAGRIRTHNPNKWAAADPRLKPRGHLDRRSWYLVWNTYPFNAFEQLRLPPTRDSIIGDCRIIIDESAPRSQRRQTTFKRTEFSLKNATVDFSILYVWGLPRATWRPHRVVCGSIYIHPCISARTLNS